MNSSIGSLSATFGTAVLQELSRKTQLSGRTEFALVRHWLTGCNECSASSRADRSDWRLASDSIRQIQVSPRGFGRQSRPIFRSTDRMVGGWRAGRPIRRSVRPNEQKVSDQSIRCCHVAVHGVDPVHRRVRDDVVHRLVDQSLDISAAAQLRRSSKIRPVVPTMPEGLERDFEPPSSEEVEELLEPTLEETINAVTDAVSTVAATVATNAGDVEFERRQSAAGPEGEGEDIVPRFERWQLNFSAPQHQRIRRAIGFLQDRVGSNWRQRSRRRCREQFGRQPRSHAESLIPNRNSDCTLSGPAPAR